jgi:hypothetical protein
MGKTPKYRNTPTHVDGIRFDSKREAKRYGELMLLQQGGAISALEVQPRYPLKAHSPDGEPVKVADYVGDFEYLEGNARVCEDVKSAATAKNPVYRLKIKMARAGYPHVEFREV